MTVSSGRGVFVQFYIGYDKICHNWCISVKTLVGMGYAFLIGFRIAKGGYINIDRNKAVIQGCRLYVHFTQHVDICLLDVFAQG